MPEHYTGYGEGDGEVACEREGERSGIVARFRGSPAPDCAHTDGNVVPSSVGRASRLCVNREAMLATAPPAEAYSLACAGAATLTMQQVMPPSAICISDSCIFCRPTNYRIVTCANITYVWSERSAAARRKRARRRLKNRPHGLPEQTACRSTCQGGVVVCHYIHQLANGWSCGKGIGEALGRQRRRAGGWVGRRHGKAVAAGGQTSWRGGVGVWRGNSSGRADMVGQARRYSGGGGRRSTGREAAAAAE